MEMHLLDIIFSFIKFETSFQIQYSSQTAMQWIGSEYRTSAPQYSPNHRTVIMDSQLEFDFLCLFVCLI